MTQSGPPVDDAGPQQEGIWEAQDDAPDPSQPGGMPLGAVPPGALPPRGLGERIASTVSVAGPAGLTYADIPNRILALAVDLILLSLSGFVLAWLLGGLVSQPGAIDAAGGELDLGAFVLVMVLQLTISAGYFGASWLFFAATPGMRLLGMRVGDEVEAGPLEPRAVVVRWLLVGIPSLLVTPAVYVPAAVGAIVSVLGLVWLLVLLYSMAQSPTRQGLHDRWAHTVVVRARRRHG